MTEESKMSGRLIKKDLLNRFKQTIEFTSSKEIRAYLSVLVHDIEKGDYDAQSPTPGQDGLMPCPFCGNPNPVIRSNGIGDLYVICDGDEGEMYCEASTSYRRCETREGAIRRWNTRAPAGGDKEKT